MNKSERHERRVRLMTVLLLLVVFLSGAVVGGAVLRWIGAPRRSDLGKPGKLGPPLSDLGLSREQEAKAVEVLARHRPQIEAVLKEAMPKVRSIQEQVEEEVRAFLTPKQKWLLDKIKKHGRPPPMPMAPPLGGRFR